MKRLTEKLELSLLGLAAVAVIALAIGLLSHSSGTGTAYAIGTTLHIECGWEAPDMTPNDTPMTYGSAGSRDDTPGVTADGPACDPSQTGGATDGRHHMTGIVANAADLPNQRQYENWVAVESTDNSAIKDVYFKVWEPYVAVPPNGPNCGPGATSPLDQIPVEVFGGSSFCLEEQHHATVDQLPPTPTNPLVSVPCGELQLAANVNMFAQAVENGEMTQLEVNDMIDQCFQGIKSVYRVHAEISNDQPCGEYRVEVTAVNETGTPFHLVNYMDNICFIHLQLDFNNVDWQTIVYYQGTAVIGGNMIFDPTGTACPNAPTGGCVAPTVLNTGNAPMYIETKFAPLVLQSDPSKRINSFASKLRAAWQTDPAALQVADPQAQGQWFCFDQQPIGHGQTGSLALSVHTPSPNQTGTYSGSLTVVARSDCAAPHSGFHTVGHTSDPGAITVNTQAQIGGSGAGMTLISECMWEAPDMSPYDPTTTYGSAGIRDDTSGVTADAPACDPPAAAAGDRHHMMGVLPNAGDLPIQRQYEAWVAVQSADISSNPDVYFKIWAPYVASPPDGPNCGPGATPPLDNIPIEVFGGNSFCLQAQYHATPDQGAPFGPSGCSPVSPTCNPLVKVPCADLQSASNTNMFAQAVENGAMTQAEVGAMIDNCFQGVKAIYLVHGNISDDQPCGEHRVESTAVNSSGTPFHNANFIDVACFPSDADGDGIEDSIDLAPSTPSLAFSDVGLPNGHTFGTIQSGSGLKVREIQNTPALNDADGVFIDSPPSTSGGQVVGCTSPVFTLTFTPLDQTAFTCSGSARVDVTEGLVTVEFGGISGNLGPGASIYVHENPPGTFEVSNLSSTQSITVGGLVLGAGATASATDPDGDNWVSSADNCPNWANPTQALPAWPVPSGDSDCDGFPDSVAAGLPNPRSAETHMGTDPVSHCAADDTRNNEGGLDRWPVDFDDNQRVNGSDFLTFAPVYGKRLGDPGYDARWDLSNDNKITGTDFLKFGPFYGKMCV